MSETTQETNVETVTLKISKEQFIEAAKAYTRRTYQTSPEVRFERLGMLVDFISRLFDEDDQ